MLHSDHPIELASDDELNRGQFIERLTRAILEWPSKESLVIGLYGPWGSGKTSLLNLLRERLKKPGLEERVITVNFNPWLYGDTAGLLKFFFSTFKASTGTSPLLNRQQRETLSSALEAIGSFVVPVFAPLTQVFTGGVNVVTPGANAMLRATQAALKGGELSFDAEKAKAGQVLTRLAERSPPTRVVVLIDDLDRTDRDEAIAMLKTVKLIAALPNVTYVLGLDQERLQRVLASGATPFDAAYLEKIVQVPIAVPAPSSAEVSELTFTALNRVLEDAGIEERIPLGGREKFDISKHVSWRLRTLRDRARLVNSFRFLFVSGEHPADIHVLDAVLVSFLHVFFPAVADRVRRHKEFLTDQYTNSQIFRRIVLKDEQQRDYNLQMLDLIIEGKTGVREIADTVSGPVSPFDELKLTDVDAEPIDPFEKSRLKGILAVLFPRTVGDRPWSHSETVEFRRDNRVAAPDRFDRYFALSERFEVPPDSDIAAWIEGSLERLRSDTPTSAEEWLLLGPALVTKWEHLEPAARADVLQRSLDRLTAMAREDAELLALAVAFGAASGFVEEGTAADFVRRLLAEHSSGGIGSHPHSTTADDHGRFLQVEQLLHQAFACIISLTSDPFDAVAAAGEHVNLWGRRARECSGDTTLEAHGIDAVLNAGLRRIDGAIAAGDNIFFASPALTSKAVWRWRDLLKSRGSDYSSIKAYLTKLIELNPEHTPLLLSLFAGWSDGYPTLEHQSLSEIKRAADEVMGWRRVLRAIVKYHQAGPNEKDRYQHLVLQLREKLRNSSARLRVTDDDTD